MSFLKDFFGAQERRKSRQEAAKADSRNAQADEFARLANNRQQQQFTRQSAVIDDIERRQQDIYSPMEQRLADQLAEGTDLDGAAALGREDFTGAFDRSMDAQRRQLARGGVQPGSETQRRMERESAFDRARGEASAANTARRAADDEQFLRESSFFSQNGSRLQQDVLAGLAATYGSDIDGKYNAAAFQQGRAGQFQQNSDRYAEQANAGLNTVMGVAGIGASLYSGGAFGGIGQAAGEEAARIGVGQVSNAALGGSMGSGAVNPSAFTQNGGMPSMGSGAVNPSAFNSNGGGSYGTQTPQNQTPNANNLFFNSGLRQQQQQIPGAIQGSAINR